MKTMKSSISLSTIIKGSEVFLQVNEEVPKMQIGEIIVLADIISLHIEKKALKIPVYQKDC